MQALRKYWVIVGAVVAVILQAVLAPAITIAGATPNFLLIYSLLVAVIHPDAKSAMLPFLLGLLYDLMGSGSVGAMALVCLVFAALLAILQQLLHNDTLFIPIALLVVGLFLAEILYAILQIACGVDVGFFDALIYIALPCGLYNAVLSAVIFPIMVRLLAGQSQQPPSVNQQQIQL